MGAGERRHGAGAGKAWAIGREWYMAARCGRGEVAVAATCQAPSWCALQARVRGMLRRCALVAYAAVAAKSLRTKHVARRHEQVAQKYKCCRKACACAVKVQSKCASAAAGAGGFTCAKSASVLKK